MKSKKITLNLFTILALIALVFVANYGISLVKKPTMAAFAAVSSVEVPISNSNFNNSTSSKYPFAPADFTSSSDVESAGVEAGVINLEAEAYKDLYKKNPNSNDLYVLMISSENDNANFSYSTSKAISMEENSNYHISVDVYTSNLNGIANLMLVDENNDVVASLDNIRSYNNWNTFHFFVQTNDISVSQLKLKLNLNKTGVVLFDNISCFRLNNAEYAHQKSLYVSNPNSFALFETRDNIDSVIELKDKFTGNNIGANTMESKVSGVALDGSTNTAIRIENTSKTQANYSTNDNFLTVKQNSMVKFSVNLKAEDLSGKVILTLTETGLKEDETGESKSLTISSNTTNDLTNNYKTYSFYVFSYANKAATFKLSVSLGDADNLTKGAIELTTATVSKINYNKFSETSVGSTEEKIDLNSKTAASADIYLANGNFNTIKISDYKTPYPATPDSWDVVVGKGNQKYGVVNTNPEEFAKLNDLGLSNLANPYDPNSNNEGNNNVLMMYNARKDSLTYTSSAKSLTEKAYHKFSVQVQTQGSPLRLSLITTKDSEEITLASTIVSTNVREWKTVQFYIYTGFQAMDVKLKLTLDSSTCAYAYVDNAHFDYLTQPTKEEFDALTGTDTVVKADLSNFINDVSSNWATPTLFKATENDTVKYGVINLNNSNLKQEVLRDENDLQKFVTLNSTNKNVIGIRSTENNNFTLTSNVGFKLSSGKFYKISVCVFTKGLQIIDKEDQSNKGASVKLTNYDSAFTAIESDGDWTTYTFYVSPNSDITTYLQLGIGSEAQATTGDVFFGGIEFDDSLENFAQVKENEFNKILTQESTDPADDNDNNKNENNNNSNKNNSALWYAIPSIIFALAIIIAVVALLARKIKWKKPSFKKSKTNDYDRQIASKQINTRKATVMREEKLRELQAELQSLVKEREDYEAGYKRDLSKLRELKIKRAPQTEINKLNKEMKKNQKLSASIGMNINKVESDIEFVKTEAYLNSLVKKLSSEKPEESENADETKEK